MKKRYLCLAALSLCSINTPLISAEKNKQHTQDIPIQKKTTPSSESISSNTANRLKSKKTSLLERNNTTGLQNNTAPMAPQNATRMGTIKRNLNTLGFTNKFGRMKDVNENLREAQNLQRFKKRQSLGSLPSRQSDQTFGSGLINPEASAPSDSGNQQGQGRDCIRGGGNPADCFSGRSGPRGNVTDGSDRPGRATDDIQTPDQGQASSAGTKSPGNSGWGRDENGTKTRGTLNFYQDGTTEETTETRTDDGTRTEYVVHDQNGNETASGAQFSNHEGEVQAEMLTLNNEDGSSTSYNREAGHQTITGTDAEGNNIQREQSSPEDDHASGVDGCVWVPAQGCTKRGASSEEMVGQPNENKEGDTGNGSIPSGIQLDAVVNTGDGSYQTSKPGSDATGFNLRNIMPDSKPEPGTPAGASR